MEKGYGHAFPLPDPSGQSLELCRVQGKELFSTGTHPPLDPEPVLPSHQGRRAVTDQGVELRSILASDLHHVLETGVGDQEDPGPLSLQEAVGGHGGSVKEAIGRGRFPHDLTAALENGVGGVSGGRWHLQGPEASFLEEEEIGERASRVHRENES